MLHLSIFYNDRVKCCVVVLSLQVDNTAFFCTYVCVLEVKVLRQCSAVWGNVSRESNVVSFISTQEKICTRNNNLAMIKEGKSTLTVTFFPPELPFSSPPSLSSLMGSQWQPPPIPPSLYCCVWEVASGYPAEML